MSALDVINIDGFAGSLSADFDAMKAAAVAYVYRFQNLVIETDEERKAAAKIRADLNSKATALERARKDAFNRYDAPKTEFKRRCDEVKQVILDQVAVIDKRLGELDAEFAERRRAALLAEYQAQAPDLMDAIPLQVYIAVEPKLLGRTWKDTKAVSVLDGLIETAVSDRAAIRAAAPKFATAADQHYCTHLDLSAALAEAKRLSDEAEARERHAEQLQMEAEARAARAMEQAGARPASAPAQAAKARKKWAMEFTATKSQATQLAEYARSIGIVSDGIREVR